MKLNNKLSKKLIIGSANFGLKYGITNVKKIPPKKINNILTYSWNNEIWGIDTASGYGDAEKILGKYLPKYKFKVITKLATKNYTNKQQIIEQAIKSLNHLNIKSIDFFLIHNFEVYRKNKSILKLAINELIKRKIIKSWGISVYHTKEVYEVLNDGNEKFAIEFPLNLFDRRFLNDEFTKIVKKRDCFLIARSVFLQGLITMNVRKLPTSLNGARSKLIKLQEFSEHYDISIPAIALLFVLAQKSIDKVVIGVDDVKQLRQNIGSFDYIDKFNSVKNFLKDIEITDENIILPYNWSNL